MNTDRSRLSNLAWSLGPLLGLVVVSLIFGAIEYQVATDEGREPQFFTSQSVQVVLNHASLIGVAALGIRPEKFRARTRSSLATYAKASPIPPTPDM